MPALRIRIAAALAVAGVAGAVIAVAEPNVVGIQRASAADPGDPRDRIGRARVIDGLAGCDADQGRPGDTVRYTRLFTGKSLVTVCMVKRPSRVAGKFEYKWKANFFPNGEQLQLDVTTDTEVIANPIRRTPTKIPFLSVPGGPHSVLTVQATGAVSGNSQERSL